MLRVALSNTRAVGNFREMGTLAGKARILPSDFYKKYADMRIEKPGEPRPPDLPRAVVQYKLSTPSKDDHFLSHPLYDEAGLYNVEITHRPPQSLGDRVAFNLMSFARSSFDWVTGYGKEMNEKKYLTRIIFLESVAGVPGMVGAAARHLRSLRRLGMRDGGRLHTLLSEAENERLHLSWSLSLPVSAGGSTDPSVFLRFMILLAQGVAVNAYAIAYTLFPKSCHRFVGYLEEEAVATYTGVIEDIDNGKLPLWQNKPASAFAKKYWHLPEDATVRDVFLAIRADEATHRQVNHVYAEIGIDEPDPFSKD